MSQDGFDDWQMHIAACPGSIERLTSAQRTPAPSGPGGSMREALASVPLRLVAVLGETPVTAHRLAELKSGDLLSFPRLGSARLEAGGVTLIRGEPGQAGGARALRLPEGTPA